MNRQHVRRWTGRALEGVTFLMTLILIVPLFSLLIYVTLRGISAVDVDFFTQLPGSAGSERVGLGNAIVGSLILLALASGIGIPTGILTGIYLAEYGNNRFARLVRFLSEVFSGIPSIVIGVFIYTLLVIRMGHFSAVAGGTALGIMMIPWITIATDEMLRTVPRDLRDAALALGVPYWYMVITVVLPVARAGLITGVLLGIARVVGETAPLLFTALNSRYWPTSLYEQIASLPVYIFTYAIQPFEDRQNLAWGGAFTLLAMILLLNIFARWAVSGRRAGRRL